MSEFAIETSARATAWLAGRREDVANLKGGMAAGQPTGLLVVASGGRPGRVA